MLGPSLVATLTEGETTAYQVKRGQELVILAEAALLAADELFHKRSLSGRAYRTCIPQSVVGTVYLTPPRGF